MSVVEPESAGSNLIDRAKNILLQPSATWDAIEAEPATIRGLYIGYAIPLAAIAAICAVVGQLVFGVGGFGITVRPSPVFAIVSGLLGFVFGLVWLYVFALIVDALWTFRKRHQLPWLIAEEERRHGGEPVMGGRRKTDPQ